MITIVAIMLSTVAQPLSRGEPTKVIARIHLTLPDEIGDAMAPYRDCKLQAEGATTKRSDGKIVPKLAKKGGDCAKYRTKAAADADEALRNLGKLEAERKIEIDKTLQDIDDFVAELARLDADAAK